jgi:hypothetical protein
VRAMDAGADSAKRLGAAATAAGAATETAAERATRALEAQAAASEKAAAAERKRLNVDKEGFSLDKSGNRLVATESDEQLQQRVGNKYGADYANDPNAIKAANLSAQLEDIRKGSGGRANRPETAALIAELAKAEAALNKTKAEKDAGKKTGTPASPAAPAASPNSSQTYLVKIDLGNGKTYDVNTSTASDAQTLISALQNARLAAGV